MTKVNVYQLVKELTGQIEPVGETYTDIRRLENLKKLIDLTRDLISDIEEVAKYNTRVEYSMKKIGKAAYEFRNELTGWQD